MKEAINEYIYRLVIPYKDIFTTVYVVKTDAGVLLFDAASFDEDVENFIVPFLDELGVSEQMLKYIFISHNHRDHVGGLRLLMEKYPDACIVSRSAQLAENYGNYSVIAPKDNDTLLDVLKVVTIPGHTQDASGILDTRTNTLISGDSLQLYGIYGSGKWGANITLPEEHYKAVEKLRAMDISCILTAHDYHPCGFKYTGREEIFHALDCCIAPLDKVKELIEHNPDSDDMQICELYNSLQYLPTLPEKVSAAIRNMMK